MKYQFSFIDFKHKSVSGRSLAKYKVYKTREEYVTIEAQTAFEAMNKSGVEKPHKLERMGIIKKALFSEAEVM